MSNARKHHYSYRGSFSGVVIMNYVTVTITVFYFPGRL